MNDCIRATVVDFQPNDLRIWEKLFKLQDIGNLGTTPAVNTLVIVTHHTDVIGLANELLQ